MKKTILLVLAGLILAGAASGITLLVSRSASTSNPAEVADAQDTQPATEQRPPTYIRLDPVFTVSFTGEQEAQFLQLALEVVTYEAGIEEALQTHMPAVRNALVMLFSSQKASDLSTRDGKEGLRHAALAEIQHVLHAYTGKTGVSDVFFTSFVMQ